MAFKKGLLSALFDRSSSRLSKDFYGLSKRFGFQLSLSVRQSAYESVFKRLSKPFFSRSSRLLLVGVFWPFVKAFITAFFGVSQSVV